MRGEKDRIEEMRRSEKRRSGAAGKMSVYGMA